MSKPKQALQTTKKSTSSNSKPTTTATKQQQQKKQEKVDMIWMKQGMAIWIEKLNPENNEDIFSQGNIVTINQEKQEVIVEPDNQTIAANRILERFEQTELDFDDMINMEVLNDAELMENVKKRFLKDKIMTYVGPTLLVVNPFKAMPQNISEEIRIKYIKHIIQAKNNPFAYKELSPHVYALAAEAYRQLLENSKDQSIVISGESGAGKTENAKFCMSLLTTIGQVELFQHQTDNLTKESMKSNTIMGGGVDILKATIKMIKQEDVSIEDKILDCNPILEAFGNSKTKRNNNSSRFGKYVRMIVNKKTRKIKGASIINYLLEKSRVTQQALEERNFHIFYHLLEGSTLEELNQLHLTQNNEKIPYDQFEYLRKCKNFVSPGINDVKLFNEFKVAINNLGMSEFQQSIFNIVAAVLLIGNVFFDGSSFGNESPCKIKNQQMMNDVQDLVKVKDLAKPLIFKQRKIGAQVIDSPLPEVDCQNAKDSLAKVLYERLFNWLVQKLNLTIQPQKSDDQSCIGLLDIYGFEVFDVNSFEQLMINYTNEKLHQLYILYVFKEEERVFVAEGLGQYCGQIEFKDNSPVIDLMEGHPGGILCQLDESCSVSSTDENLLAKIRNSQKQHSQFKIPKAISNPTFIIVHTAKDVEYNIMGFREKNQDETSVLIISTLAQSEDKLMSSIFEDNEKKGDKFLGAKVRKEMAELMKELNSCDVHFIRCIKPNEVKKANIFDQKNSLNQIRYLGVLDSLKVRKESYPYRRTFNIFYKQLSDISKDPPFSVLEQKKEDFKPYCERLVEQYFKQIPKEHFLVGKTKIFMRKEGLQKVTEIFNDKCKLKIEKAIKIQRGYRRMRWITGVKKFMDRMKRLKQQINFLAQSLRIRKYTLHVVKIQRYIRYKFQQRKLRDNKDKAKLIQTYIKRYIYLKQQQKRLKSLMTLQRWVKFLVKQKEERKKRLAKQIISISIDQVWNIIQNKKAMIIQARIRGYLTRKSKKKQIQQIKEVGRQYKINSNALTMTRLARGFLVRKRIKKWRQAAQKIQGYYKMKKLSKEFKLLRKSAKIIQFHIKKYLFNKHAYEEKFEQFVQPMVEEFQESLSSEQNQLFGSVTADSYDFMNQSYQNFQEKQDNIDSLLFLEQQIPSEKIKLFSILIDLEILTDLKEIYSESWAYKYIQLQKYLLEKETSIMYLEVGETHTIAVSAGGKAYSWGLNDFGQLGYYTDDDEQKIAQIPITSAQQLSIGENHNLILGLDGHLYGFGCNTSGQISEKLIDRVCVPEKISEDNVQFIKAIGDQSFFVQKDGSLFTQPIGSAKKCVKVQLKNVKSISCGNQFAIILLQNGQLYSYGENIEGELGLGDNTLRTDPCLIKKIEKIDQVECGFKHVIAKSSLGKVYTWGWGEKGQLGTGKYENKMQPQCIGFSDKILQVCAGHKYSLALTDKHQIQWCGSNQSIKQVAFFEQLNLKEKFIQSFKLIQDNYVPIRMQSSWSRSMSILNITFGNVRQALKTNLNLKKKLLNQIATRWTNINIQQIDPPLNEQLGNYFAEKHLKKSNNKQQIKSPRRQNVINGNDSNMNLTFISNKTSSVSQLNSSRISNYNSENSYDNIEKLKMIKQRLIKLKRIPEDRWQQSDIEFIRTVYQSNLHQLLNSLNL